MLSGLDGREICRELRKFSDVPILKLTAREEEIDRVLVKELIEAQGGEVGAESSAGETRVWFILLR